MWRAGRRWTERCHHYLRGYRPTRHRVQSLEGEWRWPSVVEDGNFVDWITMRRIEHYFEGDFVAFEDRREAVGPRQTYWVG